MLENIPISGFAICYGPLALTIIGFIAFALLTDADARRPYLRRLDPRTEEERGEEEALPVVESVVASTPSGLVVEITPGDPSSAPSPEERVDMSDETGAGAAAIQDGDGFSEQDDAPL